mmetsp:Transcript_27316/g.54650  ORF Transcript_27316/g.54650 Transcript_27316/m.54650 type:complete len:81 (+) Transcript_27316:361-603(+)
MNSTTSPTNHTSSSPSHTSPQMKPAQEPLLHDNPPNSDNDSPRDPTRSTHDDNSTPSNEMDPLRQLREGRNSDRPHPPAP